MALLRAGLSVLSWAFTRYRIDDGEVRLDSGVLFRRSRRVRIDRLQAIDIVQPLLGRALGLAELKLDMAGGAEGRVRLGYLRLEEAQQLRASLLAMAAGLDHRTPEAPQRPLVQCSGASIVGGALLSTPALFGFIWIGVLRRRRRGVGSSWRLCRRSRWCVEHLHGRLADDSAALRLHRGRVARRHATAARLVRNAIANRAAWSGSGRAHRAAVAVEDLRLGARRREHCRLRRAPS